MPLLANGSARVNLGVDGVSHGDASTRLILIERAVWHAAKISDR